MKVGTLTFPGSPSHGASLQMYALYKVLTDAGIDAEVINYVSDTLNHRKHSQKDWKGWIASFFLKDAKVSFREFESQIKILPKTPMKTTEELRKYTQVHDKIIVGSDQVWNPVVTGNDMNFYLDFCEDAQKKAAYAPSFGVDQVSEADKEKIAKLLSEIPSLSVREERGRELIYELTGRNVPVVLDPTFLIAGEAWRKMKKTSGAKGDYVFVYTIKPSPQLRQTAQNFADRHGYKLVYIAGGLHGVLDKMNPQKHPVFGVGPAEFLDLIDNAQYIFTNSFHGTAFSIIFNKNFSVEFSSDTNSRLSTLIKSFQLEDRVVKCDSFDYALRQCDYRRVNQLLEEKKKDSMLYLEGIFG